MFASATHQNPTKNVASKIRWIVMASRFFSALGLDVRPEVPIIRDKMRLSLNCIELTILSSISVSQPAFRQPASKKNVGDRPAVWTSQIFGFFACWPELLVFGRYPDAQQLGKALSMRSLFITAFALGAFCAAASSSLAAFIVPDFRGSPNSTHQEWNNFTSALNGPNLPDVANNNPNGTAQLIQTVPGAFVTSGGNIYSPGSPLSFTITTPDFNLGAGYLSTAVLQIRTLGTLPNLNSATFNGLAADSAELLFEQPLGGFGGFLRDWRFQWNNVPGNVASNVFAFASAESSMSLDRASIDTIARPVPEPGSIVLLSLVGLPALGFMRRRGP